MWTYSKQSGIIADIDSVVHCRGCGGDVWEVHKRTGTGRLPENQLKLKCRKCGMWFIVNKERLEKILGEVSDTREGT